MRNITKVLSKNKGAAGILGATIALIGLFFLNNSSLLNTTKSPIPNTSPLYQKLQSIYNGIPTEAGKTHFLKQSSNLAKKVDPELVDLDSQIITCSPNVDSLLSNTPSTGGSCAAGSSPLTSVKGKYLSGQCCGTLLDTKEHRENLEKLQAYKSMPGIPLDPFHTPIEMAKKWIDYDNNTTLTSDEQKVFDEAYKISKEKPCCCKCWHYYTNEGIAKKMIKDGTFNSKQIADYWDASDICGT